jgi:tripartite-type tricarboxylate transporter receptor subunit TctC
VSALAGHVKGGLVRPLAITSAVRNPNYADVPTVAESGAKGYEVHEWNGIFAPAGTPRDIVQRLNTALREVLESTPVKARIYALGARVVASPSADFQQFLVMEGERWGATVKAAGIRKE